MDGRPSGPVVPDLVRVRRVSLADRTVEALKRFILADELHPGDHLPSERVLADSLNVSRTVLREALSRLVSEGVLYAQAPRTLRVAPFERGTLAKGIADHPLKPPVLDAGGPARVRRRTERPGPERLSDQLVVAILTDIASGRHLPGEQFDSETEIVERFGVSRVVARQALLVLGSIHVVAVLQGRRAVVQPWTEWDLFSPLVTQVFQDVNPPPDLLAQLYETRRVMEGAAVALDATSATTEQIARIVDLAAELVDELGARRGDAEHYLILDRAFHDAVAEAAGNAPFSALLGSLFTLTRHQWTVGGVPHLMERLPASARQHRAIAAAIAARDPQAARRAMEEHIAWAKENATRGS